MSHSSAGATPSLARAESDQPIQTLTVQSLPMLINGQELDVKQLRDEHERTHLAILWMANVLALLVFVTIAYLNWSVALVIVFYAALIAVAAWVSWKLTYAFIYGHGIEVGVN